MQKCIRQKNSARAVQSIKMKTKYKWFTVLATRFTYQMDRNAGSAVIWQCWTPFLPYNTKSLKIIPYSTQKTEWLTTALPDPIQYLCRPSALQIGRGTIHAFNQLTQQRFPLRLAPRLFYANTIYGKSPIFKNICGPWIFIYINILNMQRIANTYYIHRVVVALTT